MVEMMNDLTFAELKELYYFVQQWDDDETKKVNPELYSAIQKLKMVVNYINVEDRSKFN